MKAQRLANTTIGELLFQDYLELMGMSQASLAKPIGVPEFLIEGIVDPGQRLTPEIALRLGRCFQTTPDFWLGMQTECELRAARQKVEDATLEIPWAIHL